MGCGSRLGFECTARERTPRGAADRRARRRHEHEYVLTQALHRPFERTASAAAHGPVTLPMGHNLGRSDVLSFT
jgi:hypothetical protein